MVSPLTDPRWWFWRQYVGSRRSNDEAVDGSSITRWRHVTINVYYIGAGAAGPIRTPGVAS